jgi:formyl-CoA transferase
LTASDERYVAVTARTWDEVCAVLERLGESRPAVAEDSEEALSRYVAVRPAAEAVSALREAGVPASTVNSVADLVHEPHLWSRGSLIRFHDPDLGEITVQGVMPALSRTPGKVTGWSKFVGSDNEAILGARAEAAPA